jgi:hypothetical protein
VTGRHACFWPIQLTRSDQNCSHSSMWKSGMVRQASLPLAVLPDCSCRWVKGRHSAARSRWDRRGRNYRLPWLTRRLTSPTDTCGRSEHRSEVLSERPLHHIPHPAANYEWILKPSAGGTGRADFALVPSSRGAIVKGLKHGRNDGGYPFKLGNMTYRSLAVRRRAARHRRICILTGPTGHSLDTSSIKTTQDDLCQTEKIFNLCSTHNVRLPFKLSRIKCY